MKPEGKLNYEHKPVVYQNDTSSAVVLGRLHHCESLSRVTHREVLASRNTYDQDARKRLQGVQHSVRRSKQNKTSQTAYEIGTKVGNAKGTLLTCIAFNL